MSCINGIVTETYARGEKCATVLLTEIHVGNAIPVLDEKEEIVRFKFI